MSFQGYKVELASKQLTMEFVNQSVLQPGPHEIDVPHEKLEYAEKLAELNLHWTKVRWDTRKVYHPNTEIIKKRNTPLQKQKKSAGAWIVFLPRYG